MKLTVSHRLTIRYEPARRRLLQSYRLTPTNCASQQVESWQVTPSAGISGSTFTDGAGDTTTTISVPGELEEITLDVSGVVRTFDTLGVLRDNREKVPPLTYLSSTRLVRPDAGITAMAKEALAGIDAEKSLDRAHALAQAVSGELTEDRETRSELKPAAEVMESRTGGAADQAHVLIAAAHSADIPARFVCGYLVHDSVNLDLLSEEDGADVPAVLPWPAHAWAELWLEGLGWVGFDCVNECCPDERFIRLCSGRDATDAAPLRGVAMGSGTGALEVALDVTASEQ